VNDATPGNGRENRWLRRLLWLAITVGFGIVASGATLIATNSGRITAIEKDVARVEIDGTALSQRNSHRIDSLGFYVTEINVRLTELQTSLIELRVLLQRNQNSGGRR
jgi:ribosomal protein L29